MSDDRRPTLDIIMAKLDRRPQDQIQAAVVLEAYAGRTPDESLDEVRELRPAAMPEDNRSVRPLPQGSLVDLHEFVVLVTVLASVFLWVPFVRDDLGDELATTVAWALPAALAIDRALRMRYFAAGELRTMTHGIWIVTGASLVALAVAPLLGTTIHIGVALTIVWGQASVTERRRWPLAYINVVIASATWMALGGPVEIVVTLAAVAVVTTNAIAVASSSGDERRPESGWVTLAAAITGASAGILLTADAEMWSDHQVALGLAIVTVAVAGWWGSQRLAALWTDLPNRLAGAPIGATSRRWGGHVVGNAVTGTVMRVLLPTWMFVVGALALDEPAAAALVGALSMFTVAILLLGLVVAARQWLPTALTSIASAVVAITVPAELPGLPLLLGSATSILGFGVIAAVSFRNSAATFATRMLIR